VSERLGSQGQSKRADGSRPSFAMSRTNNSVRARSRMSGRKWARRSCARARSPSRPNRPERMSRVRRSRAIPGTWRTRRRQYAGSRSKTAGTRVNGEGNPPNVRRRRASPSGTAMPGSSHRRRCGLERHGATPSRRSTHRPALCHRTESHRERARGRDRSGGCLGARGGRCRRCARARTPTTRGPRHAADSRRGARAPTGAPPSCCLARWQRRVLTSRIMKPIACHPSGQ